MANTGNKVFRLQMMIRGPIATKKIAAKTISRININPPLLLYFSFIFVLQFTDFGQLSFDDLVLAAHPRSRAFLVDPPDVLLTVRAPRPKWQAPAEL